MYKKFMIPGVLPEGSDYKPSVMEVEVPDEWNKLEAKEQDALTDLMTHYLQKRWDEQYKKVVNKEQTTILFTLLKLRALEDLKRDIRYTIFHNNLGSLGRNVLQAHAKLKGIQVKDPASCGKVSPSMLAPIQEEVHPSSSPKR